MLERISPTPRQSCLDELRRCPDPERSSFPAGESSRTLAQAFSIRQKPSRPLQEFVAILCENDPASDPVEQSASKIPLEILNLSR
jgi:hypothetical protein